jgi:hypothetical protein
MYRQWDKDMGIAMVTIVMATICVSALPRQPVFCDWGFNLERGQPIQEKWDMIPDDTDILMTHGPPIGML